MPKPNACVMAMVDAIMDRGSMLCEGGAEKKKELGKGNEERGGDGEKSNGAQFHGWVGVREGGSTTRMEEMHGEMAKTS